MTFFLGDMLCPIQRPPRSFHTILKYQYFIHQFILHAWISFRHTIQLLSYPFCTNLSCKGIPYASMLFFKCLDHECFVVRSDRSMNPPIATFTCALGSHSPLVCLRSPQCI
ncbi:hypothetical protein CFOL_v3_08611 [Cephalotus follicularis]|uniref:Uncharacterized protein n=1 Tax=Cephalotus follicularis TaxID=3775 RepID=A0A1Q3BAN5_CEPFO|nr:hypothetical protein CFOL_v3_08611 [Cephalotus follicularis]